MPLSEASLNTETNRRIAEQFNEAFNLGDLDAAASCFSEDCQNHGRKVGRDGVRRVLGEIKTNFPDARLTALNSVAEGEWVVVRCIYSGTHRGASRFPVDGGMLVNVQPTGRTFEVQHIYIYRALDGKITSRMSCNLCSGVAFGSAGGQVHAEHFANRDDVGMMMWQLGLLPPPRRCRVSRLADFSHQTSRSTGDSARQQMPYCCQMQNHGLFASISSCLRFAAARSLVLKSLVSGATMPRRRLFGSIGAKRCPSSGRARRGRGRARVSRRERSHAS
jgi:predicted ester cyclase